MTTEKQTIRVFTSPSCEPCIDFEEALAEGRVHIEGVDVGPQDVEVVDLALEENYSQINQVNLERVPVAYYGTRQCKILVDQDTHAITVDCTPPASDKQEEQEVEVG